LPFRSQAQWRWAWATGQDFADRWAKETPGGKGARFRRLPKKKRKELTLKAQADDSDRVARQPTPTTSSSTSSGGGYGAKAGQQIRGRLMRGADGKFASAGKGGGKKASGRKSGGGKSGGGGKAAKPKKSDAEKQAERDAKKAQTAAEKQAERRANIKNVGEQSPLGTNLHDALMEFSSPDENIMLAPQNQEALVKAGLVELGADGNARMSAAGRAYVSAAERGDVRAATDAVSNGTDRASRRAAIEQRRAEAEAKKKAKEEQKKGGGGGGKAKPTEAEKLAQKQQQAQQTAAATAPKAGLKSAEVDALRTAAEGGAVAEADIDGLAQLGFVQATGDNQFEATPAGRAALAALEKGDLRAYQAARQRAAAKQKEASAPFAVFKDARGAQRWLSITTSAYQDRDGEWITMKAMQGAVDLADRTGYRGPLRFWHVPGLDVGDCDYQAITDNGRFLIESGTFRSAAAARIGMAAAQKGYQMSPGFVHPPSEPQDGAYHHIALFERSFVPPGRASNPYTAFHTHKERPMLTDEKRKEFESLAADPEGMQLLESLLSQAQRTDKEAQAQQATFKDAPAWAQSLIQQVQDLDARLTDAMTPPEDAAITEKAADGTNDGDAEDMQDGGADESSEPQYVGDMTPEDFTALIVDAIKAALGGSPPAAAATDTAQTAQKDDTLAHLRTQLAQQEQRLKELEGEQPSQRGYRASQDATTVVEKEVTGPYIDTFIEQMLAGTGAG
jgi:hypothetical protein